MLNDYLRDLVKEAENVKNAKSVILDIAREIAARVTVNPSSLSEVWKGLRSALAAAMARWFILVLPF